MIRWKDSVRFDLLHGAIALAVLRANELWSQHGIAELWITSANDGKHMQGSKHYTGCAVDLRTHNVPQAKRAALARDLQAALGVQFTVIYEGVGTTNEHIHVQFNGEPRRERIGEQLA